MTEDDDVILPLLDRHKLYSMVKKPTCFKTTEGRCIDLFLTNKKHSFKHTHTFETGISDHHLMIYTMFKTTFHKIPPKTINYRCYKKFSQNCFLNDLQYNVNSIQSGNYCTFEDTFTNILDRHAPRKKKIIRGNTTPFVNKPL